MPTGKFSRRALPCPVVERSFRCTRVQSDASEDSGVTAVPGAQVTTAPVEATRRAGVSPSPATTGHTAGAGPMSPSPNTHSNQNES